jgi:hypothetical protein
MPPIKCAGSKHPNLILIFTPTPITHAGVGLLSEGGGGRIDGTGDWNISKYI